MHRAPALWPTLLSAVLLTGCTTGSRGVATPPTPAAEASALPASLLWVRRSAEYRALAHQAYAAATDHLRDTVPSLSGRAWGVILDADETVLDNSEYQRRRAVLDSAYTEASWAEWVREAAAPAVPGAVAFTQAVRRMGGHVVIVTNRADALCGPTRANLERLEVPAGAVLCQPSGESDKNPRFRRVQEGSAAAGLPALQVVAWLGDNIQDFPRLSQSMRSDPSAFARFGHVFFVLPNPMYGSWQRNTVP